MDEVEHAAQTWAEERPNGWVNFFALCPCGWRGPDRTDEIPADVDRWEHIGASPGLAAGVWIEGADGT